jgi:hypothetical protein
MIQKERHVQREQTNYQKLQKELFKKGEILLEILK